MSEQFNVFKQDGNHQIYCRWTAEEDDLLAKAVEKHGVHKWTLVAKFIPGRTPVQCSARWLGALNADLHKGRWSKAEDKILIKAVQTHNTTASTETPISWNQIAKSVPNRTGVQCQARWTEALDPAIRKGRWLLEEDRQLKAGVFKYGCCWIRVASFVPTRTQRQCRTRWNQLYSRMIKSNSLPVTPFWVSDIHDMSPNMASSPPMVSQRMNSSMFQPPPTIDSIIFGQTPNLVIDTYSCNQYTSDPNSSLSPSSSLTLSCKSDSLASPVVPINGDMSYRDDAFNHQSNESHLTTMKSSELEVFLNSMSCLQ